MSKVKKPVMQVHHVIYSDEKNKEVTRRIRKGVHWIISKIRYFKYLTNEEVDTIQLEAELKRRYDNDNTKV